MANGKKVLVVEDDEALRSALVEQFAVAGYQTLQAEDGEQGLVTALAEHPDLIILDIVMPVMDGHTMAKKLREDEWGRDARIIVLTNLKSEMKDMNEIVDHGNPTYLVKANTTLSTVIEEAKRILENT